jgi:hypothetical protein
MERRSRVVRAWAEPSLLAASETPTTRAAIGADYVRGPVRPSTG